MKKRIITLLTFILLFSLLLCSCAEGLPLSELSLVTKDKATAFSARVEALLKDGVALATNGKSDFAVLWNKSAPEQVQTAVAAFCTSFTAYSGADLLQNDPTSAKGRILIGIMSEEHSQRIAASLSPATFYIGFHEGDLIIQAKNDVMLCAALRYFCDTYLNAAKANGKRDVLLPKDLSYTAPTLLCKDDDYMLLRAEQSGEGTVEAMSRFFEEIRLVSSVRLTRKTDFNYKVGEREILFGHPNHPKANEILATLPRDAYYIGVRGQTLMILAQNDLMLNKAVDQFLALFINAEGVVADKKERQIALPATCDYYYREESVLLAEGGVNHAVLVYADDTSAQVRTAIESFRILYTRLTNTDLPAFAESEYKREWGAFEILVGRTSRTESQSLYATLPQGAWRFQASERSLAIGANGDYAFRNALEALGNTLSAQTEALSRESIYDRWQIKSGVNRQLFIFPALAQFAQDIPDLIGTYTYQTNYYSYIMQQRPSSVARFEEYGVLLTRAGLTLADSTDTDERVTAVYQSAERTVSVTYTKSNKNLRVQISTRRYRTT